MLAEVIFLLGCAVAQSKCPHMPKFKTIADCKEFDWTKGSEGYYRALMKPRTDDELLHLIDRLDDFDICIRMVQRAINDWNNGEIELSNDRVKHLTAHYKAINDELVYDMNGLKKYQTDHWNSFLRWQDENIGKRGYGAKFDEYKAKYLSDWAAHDRGIESFLKTMKYYADELERKLDEVKPRPASNKLTDTLADWENKKRICQYMIASVEKEEL